MSGLLIGAWHRTLRKYGAYGVIAAFFLCAALVITAWIPWLKSQSDVMRTEVQRMTLEHPIAAPTSVIRQVPLSQQVGEFLGGFPPHVQNPADLREVFRIAAAHQINLPKGEYQFKNDANAPLLTVTLSLPVAADYASIKAFSTELLASVPNASLDELRMTRNEAGSKVLEALVRFSFVYRKP